MLHSIHVHLCVIFVACNCHNHAIDCYYDERIAQQKRSLDINGNYEGGGVCVNCKDNTYGINCERCKPGYYRPTGVPQTSRDACQGTSQVEPSLKKRLPKILYAFILNQLMS